MKNQQENLDELIKLFPRIFHGAPPYINGYVGSGWHTIVIDLCKQIDAMLNDEQVKHVQVMQIKEKLGGLRFYMRMNTKQDEEDETCTLDEPIPLLLRTTIGQLIEAAELRSFQTCEVCGAPGKLIYNNWRQTLCRKHSEKHN